MSRNSNSTWKVEIDTTPLTTNTFVEIGGIESISWDNSEEVQEGFLLKDLGAGYSDVTAGRLNITLSGKREVGDGGQDYIVGLVGTWGASRKSTLRLTSATSGESYSIPCSIEVSSFSGGNAEELEEFECVCHSDGAWTVSV